LIYFQPWIKIHETSGEKAIKIGNKAIKSRNKHTEKLERFKF